MKIFPESFMPIERIICVLIGLVILLFVVSLVYASTDYTCMSDCTAKGYSYTYCKSQCSYDYNISPRGTDYTCMADCQRKGYMYNYCRALCSY